MTEFGNNKEEGFDQLIGTVTAEGVTAKPSLGRPGIDA